MPVSRYMRKGITRFYWVPSIASASLIPTAAEVNAGTRLDPQLSEVTGFNFENQPFEAPDMSTAFVPQISGEDKVTESSIDFYQLRGGVDTIRAAQAKGNQGNVVIFSEGIAGATPAAADKCDVWPAIVASRSKMYSTGNEAAKYKVKYTLTAQPAEDVTVT